MRGFQSVAWVAAFLCFCNCAVSAKAQQDIAPPNRPQAASSGTPLSPQNEQKPAIVNGTVVDSTGAAIPNARVVLTRGTPSITQEVQSGQDGGFSFADVAPGPYTITISASGFSAQTIAGTLHPGEPSVIPSITLLLAANVTQVQVMAPRAEIAEAEIKTEEKQLVLKVIPNFYVSYIHDAEPLNTKQKFELAWKSTINPFTFLITGAAAGIEQSQDVFSGYGQGGEGYAKRFGASYADTVAGTFIGSAILPSILKQDPRYFYKGTGSNRSRFFYALANAFMCKGDNKRWQPNYSSIAGSFAAGGISNLYYPAAERGAENTVENALIAIGESAAANVFQEFVVKKFTPGVSKHHPES